MKTEIYLYLSNVSIGNNNNIMATLPNIEERKNHVSVVSSILTEILDSTPIFTTTRLYDFEDFLNDKTNALVYRGNVIHAREVLKYDEFDLKSIADKRNVKLIVRDDEWWCCPIGEELKDFVFQVEESPRQNTNETR